MKVTVYGARWCGPCHQVKKYLADNNIEFDYIDIDEQPEAMPEGFRAIPVIKADDTFIVGMDKQRLAKVLNVDQDLQASASSSGD